MTGAAGTLAMNGVRRRHRGALLFGAVAVWCLGALLLPLAPGVSWLDHGGSAIVVLVVGGLALWVAVRGQSVVALRPVQASIATLIAAAAGAVVSIELLGDAAITGQAGLGFWLFNLGLWAAVWRGVDGIAEANLDGGWQRMADLAVPVLFGAWLLFLWQIAVVGFGVPPVLLPSPADIGGRIAISLDILYADFRQTFLKAVLAGYVIGCGSGFLVSVLVDRVPFLQRGLLPLGNLVSALPIVGVAPIMVMWFGFDWPSKAAVVVVMTFFPMLVNTVTGLAAAGSLERDVLRSYGTGYWQTLFKLRLPAAMPFVFNALKINSTLALIGAIVAEFFGTPIVGMGFRISTEVARLNVDMVWAEIVMAAVAGSLFYWVITRLERIVTFWHPSYRN